RLPRAARAGGGGGPPCPRRPQPRKTHPPTPPPPPPPPPAPHRPPPRPAATPQPPQLDQRLAQVGARLGGRQVPLQAVNKGQAAWVLQHTPHLGPAAAIEVGHPSGDHPRGAGAVV